jgi:hypothetical protein
MARLALAATAALGTGAYAITSANMWLVAHQSSWARLLGVALLAMLLVLVALVLKHGLWERAREPAARERVVLFNIVTVTTLGIGIATLYAVLFVVMGVAAGVVVPPSSFARQIQAGASVEQYVRLAWFVASVATVGGAFGSLLESNEAVRAAAYRPRAGREE